MFKIVQFAVSQRKIDANEEIGQQLAALCDWGLDRSPSYPGVGERETLVSAKVASTSTTYEALADYVKRLSGYEIELTLDYVLVVTTAPDAYDYGYCINIGKTTSGQRLVAMPKKNVDYQVARYGSGLYLSRIADAPFIY